MKNIKKLLCVVIALISVFAFNACEKNDSNKEKEEETTYPIAEELNIQAYSATCNSNKKLAEATYIGNRYFLTGTIYEINQSGDVLIRASVGNSSGMFEFTPLNEDDVLTLSKGQTVTATGTLSGLPHNYTAYFEEAVFSVE